jgi:TonB-dependent receptor
MSMSRRRGTLPQPLRARVLPALALAATVQSGVALAQQRPADSTGDDVVVLGRRPIAESEAAALEVQRQSPTLVAVASADSVGRLPDQNIAQAAGRLPGVAVQRDQGQARYINLRGAPLTWTTLSIDGITIVSPEGRDTRYDSLPSAIASQVIVRKAVTPDMTGETISGNVDLRSRSAFDYTDAHLATKLGYGYAELGNRPEYDASVVASTRLEAGGGELGFLVSGSYYQRDMITDNFETDWEQVSQDLQPGFAERIWPRETENKLYRLTRRNYSGTGRIDWRPAGGARYFLQSVFTTFTDDEARDNYIFDLDDRQADNRRGATPCTIVNNPTPANSGYADVCIGNTPLTGTVYGIDINQRATLRAFEQSIFTNTLGGNHEFGDAWRAEWRLNYTRAEDDRSVVGEARYDSPGTRNLRPTVRYDLTDRQLARVSLFRTIANANGTFAAGAPVTAIEDFQKPLSSLRTLDAVDTTDAYTVKARMEHDLPLFGGDTTLAFGLQWDRRAKEAIENERLLNTPAQFAAAGIPTTYLPVSLDTAFKGEIPLGYSFRYFDTRAMRDNVARAANVAGFTPIPANFYDVEEQVQALYAMSTTRFGWGSVVGGVRVERVDNTSQAFAAFGTSNRLVEVDNSFTLAFPSLHVNYDLDEERKLRFSLNSGAARGDFTDLRPNFTFNDAAQTVAGGNPELEPERAYGADAYYEWYVQPQGYVMVGAFYKTVRDVLFDSTRTFNLDVLDTPGFDRSSYVFSTVVNGGDGYLYGVEAALQQQLDPFVERLGLPQWLGGFGLTANVTFNESEATKPDGTKVSLPGTSDYVFNVGAYYEKYGWSMRLNYQKRSAWLDAVLPAADGGDAFWAADDELDFSARYAVRKNFEVYLDVSNLLDQPGRRYSGDSIYTIEWERFGRRVAAGVRVQL